jgi:LPXTG-motif cell wall-anchored protein
MLVFDGGTLTAQQTAAIRLPPDEPSSWAWSTPRKKPNGSQHCSPGGRQPPGPRATFTAPPCAAGPTEIAVQSADIIRRVTFRYVVTELPITGSSASVLLMTGAAMVAAGAVPVLLFRRRRPTVRSGLA